MLTCISTCESAFVWKGLAHLASRRQAHPSAFVASTVRSVVNMTRPSRRSMLRIAFTMQRCLLLESAFHSPSFESPGSCALCLNWIRCRFRLQSHRRWLVPVRCVAHRARAGKCRGDFVRQRGRQDQVSRLSSRLAVTCLLTTSLRCVSGREHPPISLAGGWFSAKD
jgi:hypothetical protein